MRPKTIRMKEKDFLRLGRQLGADRLDKAQAAEVVGLTPAEWDEVVAAGWKPPGSRNGPEGEEMYRRAELEQAGTGLRERLDQCRLLSSKKLAVGNVSDPVHATEPSSSEAPAVAEGRPLQYDLPEAIEQLELFPD